MMITSTANPRIKEIRLLHERKHREKSGTFFAEGIRIVLQAEESGAEFVWIIYSPELLKSTSALNMLDRYKQSEPTKLLEVSRNVFESISSKDGPQGIAAVIKTVKRPLIHQNEPVNGVWLALDEIADPGNLGSILRTADAVGVEGVILIGNCVDPLDPTVIRASMGAIFSVPVYRGTREEFIGWTTEQRIPLVGSSDHGTFDYQGYIYPPRMVLIMGAEREGMQKRIEEICGAVVAIPMKGSSDSLNLAAASAVILYEIYNQRRVRASRD